MVQNPIVIVSGSRTPQGKFLGAFKNLTASDLGAAVIRDAIQKCSLKPQDIQEVLMGCVLTAGQGQAPARQAALKASLLPSTECTTINKMCGSGMKAIMLAHDTLIANSQNIIVAGGMESMSNAPYLLLKARQGYRLGHDHIYDHMMLDGLEDAYEKGRPMGYFAENCAMTYQFSRDQQDAFAKASFERAQKANSEKIFATEITPIKIKDKQGELVIENDEHPLSVNIEKMAHLPAIFRENGTITAGNSCSITDGAAAVVLMRMSEAQDRKIQPLAKIIGHSCIANSPQDFPTAPIYAIKKLLNKVNWSINDVDLFEVNEAFAVVTMATMHDLKIPHEKMNVLGGGCALGHPIGATGARIVVTLLTALKSRGLKRGIAALCIGGGEATAIALEMISST